MKALPRIRCVTFDLDDTLWDCAPVIEKAELAVFAWMQEHWPRVTAAHSVETLREHRMGIASVYPELRHDLTALRLRALELIAKSHGYDCGKAAEGLALMRHHRNQVRLYEDVQTSFTTLREQGYIIGSISNGNADLAEIGIAGLFDFSVFSAEVGAAKPDSRVFGAAAARAGLTRAEVAHVGDDPANDVLGASKSGMRAIWYNPGLKAWPGGRAPDAVVQSLTALPDVLEGWAANGSGRVK